MQDYPRVCYEIFVRSFSDSNGDGIGDLNGITNQMGYLAGLGIQGIWITPVQPSPSYHKYDVTDYCGIDPEFGTLDDFRRLLSVAHEAGIRVYMDLVIHHTSIRHPWFKQAAGNPGSSYRPYYRWMSDELIDAMGLKERALTEDAHTINPWHRVQGDRERFLGIFSREMADLNFDEPRLNDEIDAVARFWLKEIGVDGFRLDAARHIYPDWEKEKNPVFWTGFAQRVAAVKPDAYLIGEVWAETETVAPFFRGLNANFNFDASFKIEAMLVSERQDRFIPWLIRQREVFAGHAAGFVDAVMLSNHDQQRIGSTLSGNTAKLKLAAAILLTLPGQPFLYYGEEIGMLGRKPDPAIREPFLWGEPSIETSWRRAVYSKKERVQPLSDALRHPASLFYVYRALIRLRNESVAIGEVQFNEIREFCAERPELLAYIRGSGEDACLVVHNLTARYQTLPLAHDIVRYGIVRYVTHTAFSLKAGVLKLGKYNSVVLTQVAGNIGQPETEVSPALS